MRFLYAVALSAILLIMIISYFADVIWVYNPQQNPSDSLYVVIYNVGQNWNNSKSPGEQAYFKEHSSHLSKLRNEKIILIGGRYSDKGMIVMKAADYNSAFNIVNSDSAVIVKTFTPEIYPINFFYKGCIE